MWNWLRGMFGRRTARERQWDTYRASGRYERIRARYDAASRDPTNYRHWMNADGMSAAAANNLGVRSRLRNCSRYETQNNCHARGITLTLANDIVGTGARLQILHEDEALCDAIEQPWNMWADEVWFADKLHTLVLETIVDGEGPGMLVNNSQLDNPVHLDLRVFECDLLTSPYHAMVKFNMQVDGIEFDEKSGYPARYHVLKVHPGDLVYFGEIAQDYATVQAKDIVHWFRQDRGGQVRGIPETTPALPIFSQLRRYTLAVLAAAEIAADFAAFIHTDAPPDEGAPDANPSAWDVSNIDKGTLTSLPHQWNVTQLKAEQPTTTHDVFTKGLLREACHALLLPYSIATADFSQESYAGGRMGLQVYQRFLKVRRQNLKSRVLDKVFRAWLEEARLVPGLLPSNLPASITAIPHTWFFDPWGHVDPVKESTSADLELASGRETFADQCAELGKDWRKQIRMQGKIRAAQEAAGVLADRVVETMKKPSIADGTAQEIPANAAA